MNRFCVFGGRNYNDKEAVFRALDFVHKKYGIDLIVSGSAHGADRLGEEWAEARGVPIERYPADWDTHGKAAGPIRNKQMAESGLRGAIGFPGGRGTKNMKQQCANNNVTVWWPEGE